MSCEAGRTIEDEPVGEGQGEGGPQHFINPPFGAGGFLVAQDGWKGAEQIGHRVALTTLALQCTQFDLDIPPVMPSVGNGMVSLLDV